MHCLYLGLVYFNQFVLKLKLGNLPTQIFSP